MEPNNQKKIHFSISPFKNRLKPQAAELIRQRRSTQGELVAFGSMSELGAVGGMELSSQAEKAEPSSGLNKPLSSAKRKQSVFHLPALTVTDGKPLKVPENIFEDDEGQDELESFPEEEEEEEEEDEAEEDEVGEAAEEKEEEEKEQEQGEQGQEGAEGGGEKGGGKGRKMEGKMEGEGKEKEEQEQEQGKEEEEKGKHLENHLNLSEP